MGRCPFCSARRAHLSSGDNWTKRCASGAGPPAALQQPALKRQQPGPRTCLPQRGLHGRAHLGALRLQRVHAPLPGGGVGVMRRDRRQRLRCTAHPSRVPGRARRPGRAGRPSIRPAARTSGDTAAAPHAGAAAPPAPDARIRCRRRPARPADWPETAPGRPGTIATKPASTLMPSSSASGTDFTGAASCSMRQAHAALGLADVERQAVERAGPLQRQREQRIRLARFQFELDLANRLAAASPARTSPTSSATSICALPLPWSSQAVRLKRVSNTGTSCARKRFRHPRQRLGRKAAPVRRAAG